MKVVYLMLPIYWDTRFNYISEESTFGAVLQSNPHHYSPESEPEEIYEGSWCWYWGNNVQNVDPDHFISDESTFCIDVNSEPDHRKLYSDFAEASKFVDNTTHSFLVSILILSRKNHTLKKVFDVLCSILLLKQHL